jgi:hypothetical protein
MNLRVGNLLVSWQVQTIIFFQDFSVNCSLVWCWGFVKTGSGWFDYFFTDILYQFQSSSIF